MFLWVMMLVGRNNYFGGASIKILIVLKNIIFKAAICNIIGKKLWPRDCTKK